jgi:Putative transposase/Transposase zinc-binding domain
VIPLAEVLRRHWPAYEDQFGHRLLPSHRAAVTAILSCRTPTLGGQRYRCACGRDHYAYHSCGHRACPQCGQDDTTQWIAKQKTKLLPVPYFLVTFTVPEGLRAVIRAHQKLLYHQLFAQSSGALLDVALTKLGIELGLLGVLHTWSRQLIFHPHVHYVVPGGGLTPDGLRWVRIKDEYFLPTHVLALRFKNRLRQQLEREHQDLLKQVPATLWRQDWVVDVQPVGSGEAVLKYLSAYVYRTALGAQRIVRDEHGRITFTYRESENGRTRPGTVSAPEFLRRFLQHVLPRGFQRVRYFGWLSPAAVRRWTRLQTLLDWRPAAVPSKSSPPPPLCPVCQLPMRFIGRIARAPPGPGP